MGMLELYRRHNPKKCNLTKPTERQCSCPIWVKGWLRDKQIKRRALKTRMWGEAECEIERWQQDPTKREAEERTAVGRSKPIFECVGKYLIHCKVENGIADSTEKSYTKTLGHLVEFLKE
jgi:hypothetical protein